MPPGCSRAKRGKPKVAITFSLQITRRIQKAVGLRITVHQFRHAAAAIYLKHRPGDYETVRRLLGHRNIQTTIDFYCGLQTTQATEQFGKLIRQQIKFDRHLAHEADVDDNRIRRGPASEGQSALAAAGSLA